MDKLEVMLKNYLLEENTWEFFERLLVSLFYLLCIFRLFCICLFLGCFVNMFISKVPPVPRYHQHLDPNSANAAAQVLLAALCKGPVTGRNGSDQILRRINYIHSFECIMLHMVQKKYVYKYIFHRLPISWKNANDLQQSMDVTPKVGTSNSTTYSKGKKHYPLVSYILGFHLHRFQICHELPPSFPSTWWRLPRARCL